MPDERGDTIRVTLRDARPHDGTPDDVRAERLRKRIEAYVAQLNAKFDLPWQIFTVDFTAQYPEMQVVYPNDARKANILIAWENAAPEFGIRIPPF